MTPLRGTVVDVKKRAPLVWGGAALAYRKVSYIYSDKRALYFFVC